LGFTVARLAKLRDDVGLRREWEAARAGAVETRTRDEARRRWRNRMVEEGLVRWYDPDGGEDPGAT
jgi:hypothetical protein